MVGIKRIVGRPQARRPEPTALPLLPLIAAILLMMAAGQIGLWVWKMVQAPRENDRVPELSVNPLRALLAPREVPAPASAEGVRRVTLPANQNLEFGNPNGRVVATILSDPACAVCRTKVLAWIAALPRDVRIVYKFLPAQPNRLTPGMLLELARSKGVAQRYMALLSQQDSDLDDARMLEILNKAGVDLETIRAALADQNGPLGERLAADIQMAKVAEIDSPPALTLNGYVIDNTNLREDRIASYAERLRDGVPLDKEGDAWLMQK